MNANQLDLNERWQICPDPHEDGEGLGFWRSDFSSRWWREVTVPSCFEAGGENLAGYEGICWYRRSFTVPTAWQTRRLVLRFEAVNYRARVWLNDQYLGENRDGFLPFELTVPPAAIRQGPWVLAVAVDNRHHPGDVPGMHVGWRGFGGIIREVALRATDPLHLQAVRVVATPSERGGDTEFRLHLANHRPCAAPAELEVIIRDAAGNDCARLVTEAERIEAGAVAELVVAGSVEQALPWSPQSPSLYTAIVRLLTEGEVIEEQETTFGFRRIEAAADGLRLNGERIYLTGFNRHDDSPRTDQAVDHELIRRDLDAIKEAGANMVRLCHYPHHPAELAHCDRIGLLVFAEIPLYFWNDRDDGKRSQAEREHTASRQLERLITRDVNHPSIIFWSVSNETPESDPEVAEANQRLIRHGRALDPNRLHVHVSNHWVEHPHFDDDDVICVNAYPSIDWQHGGHDPATYSGEAAATTWRTRLAALRERYPDKPVLVTEFGYCSFTGTQGHAFGEDEHARVLTAEFAAFDDALVCGALIWCWADHAWPAGRFLGGLAISPFGVVSRDRQRLKPFHAAKAMFTTRQGLPMADQKPPARTTSVVMIRPHLRDLPDVPFPAGYGIRPMTPQDIGLWTDIQRDAEPYITIGDGLFLRVFGDDPGALARRCFIMTDPQQRGVGTISAWYDPDFHGEDYGRIHWVAVRPSEQGKGLAKAALAYAMNKLAEWHEACYLVTSTERVPALRLYLKFGFRPDMRTPFAEQNWGSLRELLDEAGLP